ncbi:MAG: metalloregulator ArsR/SmtB family transcription factor [Patescibacteria group bacterium]
MKQLERIFKGLANRRRLAIIKILLKRKVMTVAEIAGEINLSFTSTSKHLAILRQLDIVDCQQKSLSVYYSISKSLPEVVQLLSKSISNSRE